MKKGRYLIIFLLTFFVGSFFCIKNVNSIDTETEGYELNYGATKDVNVQSAGKNLRRSATPNVYLKIFVPTKTLLEWNNFCASKPSDVNCCPVLSTAMTNGGYSDLASCNYSCNTNYFHNSNNCTQCSYSAYANYQCLQASGMWRQVSTRANGNDTECPPLYQDTANTCVYCTANSADTCTITNGVGTNPYTCTNNNKVYSGCVVATCNAGYYKANSTTCSICAAGTWTPAGNTLSSCTPCAAGTYDHDSNPATACATCTAGYYCPGGTVRNVCTAGYYSEAGASSCTFCPTGTYTAAQATFCDPCPAATCDCDSNPSTGCTACSVGQYSSAGATACTNCTNAPVGYYAYTSSSTTNNCNFTCAGGYCKSSTTTCTICGAGTWAPAGNSLAACNACTNMVNGSAYTSNASSNTCNYSCAGGYYGTGQSCTACGTGKWAPAGNNLSVCNDCTNAPAGYYAYTSNSTTNNCDFNCAAGYYKSSTTTCTVCGAGTWAPAGNTLGACNACANGTYSTGGAASCTACTNMTAGHGTYTGNATSNACPYTCTATTNSGSTIYTGYFSTSNGCATACTYSSWNTTSDCSTGGYWIALATNTNGGGATQCPSLTYTTGTACTCNDGNADTNDTFYEYCNTAGGACGAWVDIWGTTRYYGTCLQSKHTCCAYTCNCTCECSCAPDSCCSGPEC